MYCTNNSRAQQSLIRRQIRLLNIIFMFSLMLSVSALAQINKLSASDGEVKDNFGFSLAISNNTLVVGAWQNDSLRANTGAAYVFERDPTSQDWHHVMKLTPEKADFAGDAFGKAVAIDGDWIVVGAQFDDGVSKDFGAAYVFERSPDTETPWRLAGKLSARDAAFRDFFGRTVAISGTRVVVGAPEDDDAGNQSGSAYIFERNPGDGNWQEIAKLTAGDAQANDQFGSAVAIAGDTVMIGAPEHSHAGVNNTGATYVFMRDSDNGSWNQMAKLTAGDGDALDQFGYALSLVGDRALIGAPFDDDNDNVGGSAYLFERTEGTTTWRQKAKLTSASPKLGNRFGHSVSLAQDVALIGSPGDDENGQESGAAYLFHDDSSLGNWKNVHKFTPGDGNNEGEFGFAVSLSDAWALVSLHKDNKTGSAAMFRLEF